MPRESSATVVAKMIRVIQLVNDLSVSEQSRGGQPMSLEECARMLALKPNELERLIQKINMGCGDVIPELFIDYDEEKRTLTPHTINIALDKPLRLSAQEARGLLTALETAGMDREDSLASKIEGAFPSIDPHKFAAIQNAVRSSNLGDILQTLSSAINLCRPVRISYKTPSEDSATERIVEPYNLFYESHENTWYLTAFCRRANDWRTFRLDRIERITPCCNETFVSSKADELDFPRALEAIDDAPMAILAVHNPRVVKDEHDWRGLIRVESPLPHDARRLSLEEQQQGAFIAAIPWVQGSPWLPRSIACSFGGIEAIRPLELRYAVITVAQVFQKEFQKSL